MKRIWKVLIGVAVVVAVGGGAFWGGTKFEESRILANPSLLFQQGLGRRDGQFPNAQFLGGANVAPQAAADARAGGGTMGTIESVEGNVVILTTQNGTVSVQTSDTTLVEKLMSVGVSDLTVGERVVVSGSANDDGSITARSIQSQRGVGSFGAAAQ